MLSYQSKNYIRVAAASGATLLLSTFLAVIWDYFDVNDWLFPALGSWSWRTWIEASSCGVIFLIILIVIALKPGDYAFIQR